MVLLHVYYAWEPCSVDRGAHSTGADTGVKIVQTWS